VAQLKPLVVVLPQAQYQKRPWGYEVLAEKVGAVLVVLAEKPLVSLVLEYRLMEAVVFANRLRLRARPIATTCG
jgi:hypothetical protein